MSSSVFWFSDLDENNEDEKVPNMRARLEIRNNSNP